MSNDIEHIHYIGECANRMAVIQEVLHVYRLAQPGAPERFGSRLAGDLRRWLTGNGIPEDEL